MELQTILLKLFNQKIERSDCLFSWHLKDLASFSDKELYRLNDTCNYFYKDWSKKAQLVQQRIGAELFSRKTKPKFKPKIRKKRGKRGKNKQAER